MRIVGGRHKGRALSAPKGRTTRPTGDRAREALFNVLVHGIGLDLEDVSVVDLFAGTGALGLEALSRGAVFATFVDPDRQALLTVQRNAASLGEARRILNLKLDATRLPPPPRKARTPCGLAFLDAPFGQGMTRPALLALSRRGWLAEGAAVVAEIAADGEELAPPRGFRVADDRGYGAARLLFLVWEGSGE